MERNAIHELTAAYALDALDEHEEREYEDHLGRCPRCRAELASLSEAATTLAYATEAPQPSPALRDRILERARAERPNVVQLRPRWRSIPAAAAALAASVAIGLGLWAASLSRSLEGERDTREQQARVLAILSDSEAKRVALSGDYGALFVSSTGEGVLVVDDLSPAPDGKVYEAWVVEDGKPRPAGLFDGGRRAVAVGLEQPVPDRALVVVTLEPTGGVEVPGGDEIFRSAQT